MSVSRKQATPFSWDDTNTLCDTGHITLIAYITHISLPYARAAGDCRPCGVSRVSDRFMTHAPSRDYALACMCAGHRTTQRWVSLTSRHTEAPEFKVHVICCVWRWSVVWLNICLLMSTTTHLNVKSTDVTLQYPLDRKHWLCNIINNNKSSRRFKTTAQLITQCFTIFLTCRTELLLPSH